VMRRLLAAKYFLKYVFEKRGTGSSGSGGMQQYPGFLVRLLRQCTDTPVRMTVTRELQAAICLNLLSVSNSIKERGQMMQGAARAEEEVATLIVLPDVVKLLRSHTDDVIRTQLMATLVNITFHNERKKQEVIKHEMPTICNECLRSQNVDLVRQSCMLLANLTSSKAGCNAVGMVDVSGGLDKNNNIKYNLAVLLCKRDFPPYERSVVVRFEAMRVLQNLSKDASQHQKMWDCLDNREASTRSAGGETGSVFLSKLADQLKVRKTKNGAWNAKVTPLLKAVCTCLTRLCYKDPPRKEHVGRACIKLLLDLIQDDIARTNLALVIKILMLFCSLAFDTTRTNLAEFKKGTFTTVFQTVKAYGAQSPDPAQQVKHQMIDKLIQNIYKAFKRAHV